MFTSSLKLPFHVYKADGSDLHNPNFTRVLAAYCHKTAMDTLIENTHNPTSFIVHNMLLF